MRFEIGVFLMAGLSFSGPLLLGGECAAARGANPTCYINIDRETPSSPLPIRLDRNATANIKVSKRPLEKIQFDATYTDVTQPDPFVAIFSSFITPLKAVTIGVSLSGNPKGLLGMFLRTKPALGPWQPILDELGDIENDQDAAVQRPHDSQDRRGHRRERSESSAENPTRPHKFRFAGGSQDKGFVRDGRGLWSPRIRSSSCSTMRD
jgi:hypothetical protein